MVVVFVIVLLKVSGSIFMMNCSLYYIDKMLRLRVERCALRKEIAE